MKPTLSFRGINMELKVTAELIAQMPMPATTPGTDLYKVVEKCEMFGYPSIETSQSSDGRSATYCQKEQWHVITYPQQREKYDGSQFHNMPFLGTPRDSVLEITQNNYCCYRGFKNI